MKIERVHLLYYRPVPIASHAVMEDGESFSMDDRLHCFSGVVRLIEVFPRLLDDFSILNEYRAFGLVMF